jgi:ABC-2 type transport system ATP-binding protein
MRRGRKRRWQAESPLIHPEFAVSVPMSVFRATCRGTRFPRCMAASRIMISGLFVRAMPTRCRVSSVGVRLQTLMDTAGAKAVNDLRRAAQRASRRGTQSFIDPRVGGVGGRLLQSSSLLVNFQESLSRLDIHLLWLRGRGCVGLSSMSALFRYQILLSLRQMAIAAIQTYGLTRRFGELTAVDNVTFSVAPGQFFGFLGPNGAGKSTTIKMLTGLLEPSAGSVQILGQPFGAGALDLKRQIGVVPEGMALLGRLTATEYLHFVGRMYGLDRETTRQRTQELLEFMQLANETKKLVTDFSHGMQKKLALAAAVIHGPKVLFLDEPFEGVDAIAAGTLKAMLQGMIHHGATVFLTSHVLEIVERLCSHVAIIDRGKLVAHGSLEELRAGVPLRSSETANSGAANSDTRTLGPCTLGPRSLEEIFLDIVGRGEESATQELSWLA